MNEKCAPIRSLEELYMWQCRSGRNTNLKKSASKCFVPDGKQGKFGLQDHKSTPKTIVCHDMKGGYLDDCYINGCTNNEAYLFTFWNIIDTFVYFSHHFITIPPPCWVHSAHLHGVTILGTVITEWDEGSRICDQIFFSKESVDYFVSCLAAVTVSNDIDGWLINIENPIVESMVENIIYFLKSLKIVLSALGNNSTIIWYDSVTREGKLDWQNELNLLNRDFFDACDGIFLNYTWTREHLGRTIVEAGERKKDVYVGVDVFGRNCYGGGGFNTAAALSIAREFQLSVAIFAPGWVHETHPLQDFHFYNEKFWSLLLPHLALRGSASLPILTSFCTGLGKAEYFKGKLISSKPWYNISKQQQQPLLAGLLYGLPNDDANLNLALESLKWGSFLKLGLQNICYDDAFNGGGCLLIESSECAIFPLIFCEIPATKDMVFALAYKGDTEYSLSLNIVFEEPETLEISHSSCSLQPMKTDETKINKDQTESPKVKAPKLFPSTSFEDLVLRSDLVPAATTSDGGWETRLFRIAVDSEEEKWILRAVNLTSKRKVRCKIGFLGLF